MKKIIASMLVLLVIIGSFVGCKESAPTVAVGEYISRGAWVKLLSDSFYLNSSTEEPYFSDISKEDELFNSVQSCVDLEIIEDDDNFNKDSAVTYREIALNAVHAMGISTVQDYLKTDDEKLNEKQLLTFAVDNGIVENTSKEFSTVTDAEKAVDRAVELYLNKPFIEKNNIQLKEDVIELKNTDIDIVDDSFTYKEAETLEVGDIIILPATEEYKGGLARKVEAISGNTVTTTAPKLEEVYETLQLSSVTVPALSDIKPANEGVSFENVAEAELTSTNLQPKATSLSLVSKADNNITLLGNNGASFDININITKGKLSVDKTWDSLTENFSETDIKNNYPQFKFDENGNMYTSKYKSGYEIKGKISISNLSLTNEIDFGLFKGLKKAESKVNFDASVNLSVKGKINETIDVFTASIPIGATGLWVDAVFSVVFDSNGDISVKCTLENQTTYTYEKGLKTANNTKLNNNAAISGNITAKVGPRAVLVALGIDLFDIQAMIGLASKAKISAEQGTSEIPCVDINVYAPIVTLAFAGDKNTLVNQLGYSASWKVYDIDGGWQKPLTTLTYHFEAKNGWVNKCTHPEKTNDKNTVTSSQQSSSQQSSSQQSSSQQNSSQQSSSQQITSSQQTPSSSSNSTSSGSQDNSSSKAEEVTWTYENGGYDYIIKTDGKTTEKIKIDATDLPPEIKAKNEYDYNQLTIERYNFTEAGNYIYFCQRYQYKRVEIKDRPGQSVGSVGGSARYEFCRIYKDGSSYEVIGEWILDEYGYKTYLGSDDSYFYFEFGGGYWPYGDVCRVKIDDSLNDIVAKREFLFSGENLILKDEPHGLIDSYVEGDWLFYKYEISSTDDTTEIFQCKIKLDGSNQTIIG